MLVVPRSVVRLPIGLTPGEDGVDFSEPLVIHRREGHRRLRLDEDAAALGEIHRLGRSEDAVLVDGVDGFHAG